MCAKPRHPPGGALRVARSVDPTLRASADDLGASGHEIVISVPEDINLDAFELGSGALTHAAL
jgi:hypothetical protein